MIIEDIQKGRYSKGAIVYDNNNCHFGVVLSSGERRLCQQHSELSASLETIKGNDADTAGDYGRNKKRVVFKGIQAANQ